MLKKAYIRDFAIIDEMSIDFSNGLTIITGETGAGKSIILQALSVVLGEGGTKTMVKTGKNQSVVEAEIKDKTYRRLISSSGRLKSYIDDEPLAVKNYKLNTVGLVDFHGQHEQQLIMNPDTHIDYLDNFCGLRSKVDELGSIYFSLKEARQNLIDVQDAKSRQEEKRDLLEFQKQEIDLVNLQQDEDIELRSEFKKMSHIEELVTSVERIVYALIESDQSLYNQAASLSDELNPLTKYDQTLQPISESLSSILLSVKDISENLSQYQQTLDYQPNQLSEIQERLNAVEKLLRKYGGTTESVLLTRDQIVEELESLSSLSEKEQYFQKRISELESAYSDLALLIHNIRSKSLSNLSSLVEKEMHSLSMPNAVFEVRLSQKEEETSFITHNGIKVKASPKGIDLVDFYLSANPGERPKPLTKIASGGEISRIMLSLKTVFQKHDPIQTMVFDEIDTGISGIAAEKVAESLMKLSKEKQVICITHLPQISNIADHHLHVTKIIQNGETKVTAEYLKTD